MTSKRPCAARWERPNGSRCECERPARHAGVHECHCGTRWEPRIRPFPSSYYLTDESRGGDFTHG